MAYPVSQDFKEKIKDAQAEKSCVLLFDDCFFSTEDLVGDVTFNQYFNTSDDLTFGDCPSDTLSFSVLSNGTLSGYNFGKCKTYLGVQTNLGYWLSTNNPTAFIIVGGKSYECYNGGVYRANTRLADCDCYYFVSDGRYVWGVGSSSGIKIDTTNNSVESYTPTRFMANKLHDENGAISGAIFDEENLTAKVWYRDDRYIEYEYVPMGVYNVEKPRSTIGDTVVISDAYDNMRLFDRDAAEFVASLTYPITLGEIYTALCDFVGVEYVSDVFDHSTQSYSASPFIDNAFSCRDILGWIAGAAHSVAHIDRTGRAELRWFGETEETLGASDIAQDGYSLAEYKTSKVSGVLLKSSSGASLTYGDVNTSPYLIYANPFISSVSGDEYEIYRGIPIYVPMELSIIEADPSIDVGDVIGVQPLVEEIQLLTDVFGNVFTITENAQNTALALESPTYNLPLMNRTITFNGGISAEYSATGNETRSIDRDFNTEYNANVAPVSQEGVFNRLTNGDLNQGIYLENGKIYVNAEYIKVGTLTAIEINNGNGTFKVSPSGEITATSGKIGAFDISTSSSKALIKRGTDGDDSTMAGMGGARAFWAGSSTSSSAPFRVTYEGGLYASNATITGSITATSGTIGKVNINSTASNRYLYIGSGSTMCGMGSTNQAFWAGSGTADSAPFRVTYDGKLTATDANITGTITSSNATITGGSIKIVSSSATYDTIELTYGDSIAQMRPGRLYIKYGSSAGGAWQSSEITPSYIEVGSYGASVIRSQISASSILLQSATTSSSTWNTNGISFRAGTNTLNISCSDSNVSISNGGVLRTSLSGSGDGLDFFNASGNLSGHVSPSIKTYFSSSIAASGSYTHTFDVTGAHRGMIIFAGSAAATRGAVSWNITSSGTLATTWLGTALSSVSITGNTSGITITNNTSYALYAFYIYN